MNSRTKLLSIACIISVLLPQMKNTSVVFAGGSDTNPQTADTTYTSVFPDKTDDEKKVLQILSRMLQEKCKPPIDKRKDEQPTGRKRPSKTIAQKRPRLETVPSENQLKEESRSIPVTTPAAIDPKSLPITESTSKKPSTSTLTAREFEAKEYITYVLNHHPTMLSNKAICAIETFISGNLCRTVKFKLEESENPVTLIEAAIIKNNWRILQKILGYPKVYNLSTDPAFVEHLYELARGTLRNDKIMALLRKGSEVNFNRPILLFYR